MVAAACRAEIDTGRRLIEGARSGEIVACMGAIKWCDYSDTAGRHG
jgi:hypothetical protein